MFIKITPLDTLFFRDGKPFSMGEETWATSFTLPNPSVIWGTLFSVLWLENPDTDKSILKIKGIYLLRKATDKAAQKILIPAPLDLSYEEKTNKNEFDTYPERYEEIENLVSNYSSLTYLTLPDVNEKVEQTENCFIDWTNFLENYPYRNNDTRIYQSTYFNKKMGKIGIARMNSTRVSEEGKLYRIEMNEYDKDWCFLVEVEDLAFPKSGVLKMGGDGKAAAFEVVNKQPFTSIELPEEEEKWFKLYFQTPNFFKSGNGLAELSNLQNATLYSASVGKPISIGGFDLEKKAPKPMTKFVPPGSVYLFKGNPKKASDEINSMLSTEKNRQQGFGQFHLITLKE